MIPNTLVEWSEPVVRQLLAAQVFETDTLEFKVRLPQDDKGRARLRRTCAAFANTLGGFIVLGIADDRALSPDERLVGFDATVEVPRDFGDYPGLCTPSVNYLFKQPAIVLPNGRLLHVVHIPKSAIPPHAVGSNDEGWRFPKRTNRGDAWMSVEEIRASFVSLADTQRRLLALKRQLEHNLETWETQRQKTTSFPVRAILRAVEDFLTVPIFEEEIPLSLLRDIWNISQVIDEIVVSGLRPSLTTVPAKEALMQCLQNQLDDVIPRAQDVVQRVTSILERIRPRRGPLDGARSA